MKDDLCEVGRCEIERECVRGDRVQREGGGGIQMKGSTSISTKRTKTLNRESYKDKRHMRGSQQISGG